MLHKIRLLTPGPTPLPDRVRFALAQDMIHHRSAAYKDILASIQPRLQQLFGTQESVIPLACTGTGAMTAAIHTLFSTRDAILVVEGGIFAERWRKIAEVHDLIVHVLEVPWGEGVQAAQVADILDAHPEIVGVCLQASETSTGVLHPVGEVAAITRKRAVLCVVDGISSLGIAPCPMDELGIDCLITGSQKGLMLPPGLALIALSDRAWERAKTIKPSCFYFNLLGEREQVKKNQSLFTPPINLIVGLHEALDILFENNTLEAIYSKQWALTCMTRAGVSALGLKLFAPKHYAWGLTSLILPEGINSTQVRKHMLDDHGVLITAGSRHLADSMIRIGHMGWLDYGDILVGLQALGSSLVSCDASSKPCTPSTGNALDIALKAYHAALKVPAGTEPA